MLFSDEEKQIFESDYNLIAGVDEVGRGCLAGPVTAGIVAISKDDFDLSLLSEFYSSLKLDSIRDSKHLSQIQREKIFEAIKKEPRIKWQVSFVSPQIIDKINISQATFLAWQKCFEKLGDTLESQPDFLFIDGNFSLPNLNIKQESIIKGDQKIFLISLASIVAKVSRDKLMEKLDQKYPNYGFCQHKGYGTKLHLEKLKQNGCCHIHRKTFKPVSIAK